MYCLWPLPRLLFVCTTLVPVLFGATPTSTISVYYSSICTLLKYVYCLYSYSYYFIGVHVYCLWPLPHMLLVCPFSVDPY